MSFSESFVWGVATASYQVEGAIDQGGRGESVWDMFCRKPGAVFNGDTGARACDHYNRYRDDIRLMKDLGVGAYRFSVAWPRVIPDGFGEVNEEGLDFYDRLVDELLSAGIQPWVTLYHWDTPLELYRRGAWLSPEMPKWFERYAQTVVERLSDRVGTWMTLNEPQVFIGLGMEEGRHAPGDKIARRELMQAFHHTLLAHGLSVQVIRAYGKKPAKVGAAPVGGGFVPKTSSEEDVEAARAATFSATRASVWDNTMWMDPAVLGHYPEDGLRALGADAPKVAPGDMETIRQKIDFFGANMYTGQVVESDGNGDWRKAPDEPGMPRNTYRWTVVPEVLYWGPKFFYERYGLPIVITENGVSNTDWVHRDGKVHDPQRIDYLARYIGQFKKAADDGVEAWGYFHWSFMDNFEWNEGYRERFGLVYVDYATQERIPKDSFDWYKNVIRSNGTEL